MSPRDDALETQRPADDALETQETPIACTLSDRDRAVRRDEIARTVGAGRQEVRELADGYAARFPSDDAWAAKLLALIAGERACCPFFTFELIFEPRQGPIWLRVRGPEGAKAIAAALLAYS